MATYSDNIFYAYSGSLAGVDLGLASLNLLNQISGPQNGTIEQTGTAANGTLSSADNAQSMFTNESGAQTTFTYLGSGQASLIGLLGLNIGSVPAAAFETSDGDIYFVFPDGPPNLLGLSLGGLSLDFDLDPDTPFNIPGDGVVDGGTAGQSMPVGFVDADGDRITDGADSIRGNDGNDSIGAGGGDDSISGGAGDDLVLGGLGDDRVSGDAGDDDLTGGAGDDTIDGGAGSDSLTGGTGNDTFILSGGTDTVSDFVEDATAINDGDRTNNDFIDLGGIYNTATLATANAQLGPGDGFKTALALLKADAADGRIDGVVEGQIIDAINGRIDLKLGLDGAPVDVDVLTKDTTNVICFTAGTTIQTKKGSMPVECLRPGDRVLTADNGFQELRWIGTTTVAGQGNLAPVLVSAEANGATRDTLVSPNHRVIVRSPQVHLFTGERECLVAAKHLVPVGLARTEPTREITYVHLLFDHHEILFNNNGLSESFFPGAEAMNTLDRDTRAEIHMLFPEISTPANIELPFQAARMCLKPFEAVAAFSF